MLKKKPRWKDIENLGEKAFRIGYKSKDYSRGSRLFQILEMVSFGDHTSIEVFHKPAYTPPILDGFEALAEPLSTPISEELLQEMFNPNPRYSVALVRWHHGHDMNRLIEFLKNPADSFDLNPTTQTYIADLEIEKIEPILERLKSTHIPLWINEWSGGTDGTMYEAMFYGAYIHGAKINWHSYYPSAWEPLIKIVD